MIKVIIQIIPFGFGEPEELGRMNIWNDGSGTSTLGNYGYKIFRKGSKTAITKSGEIKNFKRKQWNVWYLLYLVLKNIYEKDS